MARFEKGKSGNPAGRPKGANGIKTDLLYVYKKLFAEPIIKKDANGNEKKIKLTPQQELLAGLMAIYRDKKNPVQVRAKVAETLMTYLYSKPAQEIEMSAETTVHNDKTPNIKESLDKLSPEERELYLDLCDKVNEEDAADSEQ